MYTSSNRCILYTGTCDKSTAAVAGSLVYEKKYPAVWTEYVYDQTKFMKFTGYNTVDDVSLDVQTKATRDECLAHCKLNSQCASAFYSAAKECQLKAVATRDYSAKLVEGADGDLYEINDDPFNIKLEPYTSPARSCPISKYAIRLTSDGAEVTAPVSAAVDDATKKVKITFSQRSYEYKPAVVTFYVAVFTGTKNLFETNLMKSASGAEQFTITSKCGAYSTNIIDTATSHLKHEKTVSSAVFRIDTILNLNPQCGLSASLSGPSAPSLSIETTSKDK